MANNTLKNLSHAANEYQVMYFAVDAFAQYVVSLEDMLGWLLVLRDWLPGTPDRSLFALLDTVQVGRRTKEVDWTEENAMELLDSLTAETFRQLIHLPTSAELLSAGWESEYVNALEKAMPHLLDGFKEGCQRRTDKNRALVRGYNKSKHMMLGILRRGEESNLEVALLTSEFGWTDLKKGIYLAGNIVTSKESVIQTHLYWVIQMQAVLNSMLTGLLWTRYGERIDSPKWAVDASNLPGWK